jgi:peptidyl-dipeptidase Dcp
MERAGSDFKRHDGLWIYSSNLNSPEFEPIEREMGPLASLSSKIYQNKNYSKELKPLQFSR